MTENLTPEQREQLLEVKYLLGTLTFEEGRELALLLGARCEWCGIGSDGDPVRWSGADIAAVNTEGLRHVWSADAPTIWIALFKRRLGQHVVR